MLNLKTDKEISQLAWFAYQDAPMSVRLLSSLRTYICPMQPLITQVPRDATIFDIGCGSGLFLSLLLARGQSIKGIGCEPNRQAIASAQKASKRLLDRVDREQNPMTVDFIESTTPQDWPQDTFSVVSLIDVMHHIPPQQQQAFFEAAVRRVRRG